MKHLVIMADGMEVIGKVKFTSAETISISDPVLFIDLFQLDAEVAAVWYSKNNSIQFNRQAITYEYEPADSVVELYENYINSEPYKKIKTTVNDMLQLQVARVKGQINSTSEDTSGVIDILQKILNDRRKLH